MAPTGPHALDDLWQSRLKSREDQFLFRQFGEPRNPHAIDFYSNDYLGLCSAESSKKDLVEWLSDQKWLGASGSRLVSGQYEALENLESACSEFFKSETGIFFPNGYVANLALLSCMATRHDTIIYDEQSHVSLKEGLRLSLAKSFPFRNNDLEDLEKKLKSATGQKFVVAESIYSMSGHIALLKELVSLCRKENALLILDEAHSTGVLGEKGQGLAISMGFENEVWARNYTFGKALGASGAFLALSGTAKKYLTNFSFPLIYSTSPLPVQVALCGFQLKTLQAENHRIKELQEKIRNWNQQDSDKYLTHSKNENSPVQFVSVPDNERALQMAKYLNQNGFQIKAMLSPTVKKGSEGLRISLHSYNSPSDYKLLWQAILKFENIFESKF